MTFESHKGQPILHFGAAIGEADLIVILLHGRGSDAQGMLPLAQALAAAGSRFLIPQAAQQTWYPQTAFGPMEANEPELSSALAVIDSLVQDAHEGGLEDEQIVFGGFSQGACLAAEYVLRSPMRYGGLFILSGARIGPPGDLREYRGTFDGMPVFIGGSDADPWIPQDLQADTARIFERLGAEVDFQTYPGIGHSVIPDEIDRVRALLFAASESAAGAVTGRRLP